MALCRERGSDYRIRRNKAARYRIVETMVEVYQTQIVVLLLAREANVNVS